MSKLTEYLDHNATRGDCICGKCVDATEKQNQPNGHTIDVSFFHVSAGMDANADTLSEIVREHKGEFADVDLFDGKEHNYIEIGGWIGDQGYALMLMGLGTLLGLWKLLTPRSMLGTNLPDDIVMQMAGMGLVAVQTGKGSNDQR